MSTLTSPRLSTESTSTVNSIQSSSNGANESSARRRLREFYKLQERPSSTPTLSVAEQDEDDGEDLEDNDQPELDQDDVSVEAYVSSLVQQNDIKNLLKKENGLVQQLGALDSKQKALVYNNYNKLISASSTLQGVIGDYSSGADTDQGGENQEGQENRKLNVNVEELKHSLQKIASITSSSGPLENQKPDAKTQETIQAKQAARWVLSVEKHMTSLKNLGRRNEAISQGEKAVKLIDSWIEASREGDPEIKELSLIRERCQGMLNVL